MKRLVCAALAASVLVLFHVPAFAGGVQEIGPKFAAHTQPHPAKTGGICTTDSPNTNNIACSAYVTTAGLLTGVDVYVVVANADTLGISGVSYGIAYEDLGGTGIDVFGWFRCNSSGLDFPSDNPPWPASGAGTRLTWDSGSDCQKTVIGSDGVHAVSGAFYLYGYGDDSFQVTPNLPLLSGPELAITICPNNLTLFAVDGSEGRVARVDFGLGAAGTDGNGCNPCTGFCFTPTAHTTWGKIKSKYGE